MKDAEDEIDILRNQNGQQESENATLKAEVEKLHSHVMSERALAAESTDKLPRLQTLVDEAQALRCCGRSSWSSVLCFVV